jgi:HSP20 family protein
MTRLRRTNGFHPLDQLRSQMDRLVGDFFGPMTGAYAPRSAVAQRSFPALNIWEYGDDLYAEAELPGLKSDDIDVSVVGGDLTIRGRRGEEPAEGTSYHRRERGVGEFTRVVRLPADVDAQRVEATLKDGVLLVKLPKAESAKPKKIKVAVS